MAEDSSTAKQTGTGSSSISSLSIPQDIAEKFPELIQMIQASRSMNDEERQYWIDALSIMSEDQVQNLYTILDNERKQIQAAEENYKKNAPPPPKKAVAFDEKAYLEKKQVRLEAEHLEETAEKKEEESLLAQLALL